jgi:Glycosyl transferase 4-like domain
MTTTVRLVYITTAPCTLVFLKGQLAYMGRRGFNVVVISAPSDGIFPVDEFRLLRERERERTTAIPMVREISPLKDLVSLVRIYRVLRRLRPAIVNAGMPKAGLLGMIAAFAARVPVRIYSLHGLRLNSWVPQARDHALRRKDTSSKLKQRVENGRFTLTCQRRLNGRMGFTNPSQEAGPSRDSDCDAFAARQGCEATPNAELTTPNTSTWLLR